MVGLDRRTRDSVPHPSLRRREVLLAQRGAAVSDHGVGHELCRDAAARRLPRQWPVLGPSGGHRRQHLHRHPAQRCAPRRSRRRLRRAQRQEHVHAECWRVHPVPGQRRYVRQRLVQHEADFVHWRQRVRLLQVNDRDRRGMRLGASGHATRLRHGSRLRRGPVGEPPRGAGGVDRVSPSRARRRHPTDLRPADQRSSLDTGRRRACDVRGDGAVPREDPGGRTRWCSRK